MRSELVISAEGRNLLDSVTRDFSVAIAPLCIGNWRCKVLRLYKIRQKRKTCHEILRRYKVGEKNLV